MSPPEHYTLRHLKTGGKEIKKVDDYKLIHNVYHIEGLIIREISRRHGHVRKLIRKALEHPVAERYQLDQPRNANVLGKCR